MGCAESRKEEPAAIRIISDNQQNRGRAEDLDQSRLCERLRGYSEIRTSSRQSAAEDILENWKTFQEVSFRQNLDTLRKDLDSTYGKVPSLDDKLPSFGKHESYIDTNLRSGFESLTFSPSK